MVWPGMNQVLGRWYSPSRSTRRWAPTSPNSPRAMRFGDLDRRGPTHTEMASKSNVRQTDTSLVVIGAASHSFSPGSVLHVGAGEGGRPADQRVVDLDVLDVDEPPGRDVARPAIGVVLDQHVVGRHVLVLGDHEPEPTGRHGGGELHRPRPAHEVG